MYIYIHLYSERERERESERQKEVYFCWYWFVLLSVSAHDAACVSKMLALWSFHHHLFVPTGPSAAGMPNEQADGQT